MKVCHFLPWYSPANKGGTEIYILNLCKLLMSVGEEVLIICPSKDKITEEFKIDGISIIATPAIVMEQTANVDFGIEEPVGFSDFEQLLVNLKPDVLHFHCFWRRHIFYLEKATSLKIKTFITPHLSLFSCLQVNLMQANKTPCDGVVELRKCSECLIHAKTGNRMLQRLIASSSAAVNKFNVSLKETNKVTRSLNVFRNVENLINVFKRINKSADGIITISQWYFDVLKNGGYFDPGKLKLIPTAVNYGSADKKEKKAKENLSIAFAGRQSYEKGIHLLLEAVRKLPVNSLELHLFGKETEPAISGEIELLQKDGYRVFQYFETEHNQMMNKIAEIDLLCMPSVSIEMSPMAVNEALALNVPVIGTDRGGIKDLIEHGKNGLLFKYNDASDLFSKLKEVLENKQLLGKLKSNCRSKITNNEFVSMHLNVYNSKN